MERPVKLDPIARDTIRQFASTLRRAGFSPEDVSAEFNRCIAKAPRARQSANRASASGFHDAGHVLTLWASDPDCVDEAGRPRALPVRGPAPSVEALLGRVQPQLTFEEALDLLLRTHTLRRVGRKLIPADETVIHSPESKTQSTHHLLVLNQLLRNFDFNSRQRPGAQRWLQRVVECPNFPADAIPALMSRFSESATQLIRQFDHGMARTARRANPSATRVRPAINLFFAVNPSRTRGNRSR
jgi:hypothetical protein